MPNRGEREDISTVDHAAWAITSMFPEEQTFFGCTRSEELAWCLVWSRPREVGRGQYLGCPNAAVIVHRPEPSHCKSRTPLARRTVQSTPHRHSAARAITAVRTDPLSPAILGRPV